MRAPRQIAAHASTEPHWYRRTTVTTWGHHGRSGQSSTDRTTDDRRNKGQSCSSLLIACSSQQDRISNFSDKNSDCTTPKKSPPCGTLRKVLLQRHTPPDRVITLEYLIWISRKTPRSHHHASTNARGPRLIRRWTPRFSSPRRNTTCWGLCHGLPQHSMRRICI
jgi:hypothetical protein